MGHATLASVGEAGIGGAMSSPDPGLSWDDEASWVEILAEAELDPPPDWDWLTYWAEGDLEWPKGFDEPIVSGSKLVSRRLRISFSRHGMPSRHVSL